MRLVRRKKDFEGMNLIEEVGTELVNEESGTGAMLSHSFLPNVLLRASTFHLIRTLPRFRLLSAHPVEMRREG